MSMNSEMDRIANSLDRVEDGKTAAAEAITAKGVDTLPDADFDTLALNIGLISEGEPMEEYVLDSEYTFDTDTAGAVISFTPTSDVFFVFSGMSGDSSSRMLFAGATGAANVIPTFTANRSYVVHARITAGIGQRVEIFTIGNAVYSAAVSSYLYVNNAFSTLNTVTLKNITIPAGGKVKVYRK